MHVISGVERHKARTAARDAGNLGLSDEDQLEYARRKNMVIVTHDDDFLSLAMKFEHKGIVFVHQQKYSIGDLIRNLKLLWDVVDRKSRYFNIYLNKV
ncbi:MAG TPA: hypothetical protein ENG83_08100 [Nitrospirae bacterium]|nr:hypothetical protein BMS3Abin06_00487 [bacterium BMS3Abin06]HDH12142.1 hypothetical protein [Nitrospirota bacterium]HDZ00119.1 hypothetical protein [Nitrospirota bacterium]